MRQFVCTVYFYSLYNLLPFNSNSLHNLYTLLQFISIICKVKQFIQFGDMRQFFSTLCTIYHLDSSLVFVDYGWMDNGSF